MGFISINARHFGSLLFPSKSKKIVWKCEPLANSIRMIQQKCESLPNQTDGNLFLSKKWSIHHTPPKFNMEPQNEGLVQMFQPLVLGGVVKVQWCKPTAIPSKRNVWKMMFLSDMTIFPGLESILLSDFYASGGGALDSHDFWCPKPQELRAECGVVAIEDVLL